MSWSKTFVARIEDVFQVAEDTKPSLTVGYAEVEQSVAIRITTLAAVQLAGVLGPPSASVRVSMSGHANPDNEAQDGWARDEVRLHIERIEQ